jgi:hypothetical protein
VLLVDVAEKIGGGSGRGGKRPSAKDEPRVPLTYGIRETAAGGSEARNGHAGDHDRNHNNSGEGQDGDGDQPEEEEEEAKMRHVRSEVYKSMRIKQLKKVI